MAAFLSRFGSRPKTLKQSTYVLCTYCICNKNNNNNNNSNYNSNNNNTIEGNWYDTERHYLSKEGNSPLNKQVNFTF